MQIRRGFHRIGLGLFIPLTCAALIATAIGVGLIALPQTVGPIFGVRNSDFKVTAPDGTSFDISDVLHQERNNTLNPHRKELLEEARRRGLIPLEANYEATRSAASDSFSVAGILAALAVVWYALAAGIGWIIAGFMD